MQSQAVAPRRRRTSLFVFCVNYTYPPFRGGGRESAGYPKEVFGNPKQPTGRILCGCGLCDDARRLMEGGSKVCKTFVRRFDSIRGSKILRRISPLLRSLYLVNRTWIAALQHEADSA